MGTYDNKSNTVKIFTHRHIVIGYNNQSIVRVNINLGNEKDVQYDSSYTLTYQVTWEEAKDIDFQSRFTRFLDQDFFNSSIRFYAIFGSVGLLLFQFLYSRTINQAVSSSQPDVENQKSDNSWISLSGDVWRTPSHPMIFSSLVGAGAQWLVIIIVLLIMAAITQAYK